jgi:hypothetical protein
MGLGLSLLCLGAVLNHINGGAVLSVNVIQNCQKTIKR